VGATENYACPSATKASAAATPSAADDEIDPVPQLEIHVEPIG
jgi:hypothetical protein